MYNVEYNALVVPAVDGDFVGDGRSTHGVYPTPQSSNIPDYYSHVRGEVAWRNQKLQDEYINDHSIEESLSGSWVFLGIYLQPFGHFLSESIHRLWYLIDNQDSIDGVIFISSVHQKNYSLDKAPSYVKSVIKYYAPNLKVKFLDKLTKVERLIIPEPGSQLGAASKEWYKAFNKNYFMGQSVSLTVHLDFPTKIIMSRSRFFDKGRLLGIDYYWSILEQLGYKIINPETYPLDKQLSILSNAEVVIWEEGSAMHLLELFNVVYSKQVLITRRPTSNGIYSLSNFLKRKADDVNVYDSIVQVDSPGVPSHNRLSLVKSPTDLRCFLEDTLDISLVGFNTSSYYQREFADLKKLALSNNITRDYLIDSSYKLASIRAKNEQH